MNTYFVRRTKCDKEFMLANGTMELVKAGTRILVRDCGNCCEAIAWKELSTAEVREQVEYNECFRFLDSVTTRKGNTIKIYEDYETTEVFFEVIKNK